MWHLRRVFTCNSENIIHRAESTVLKHLREKQDKAFDVWVASNIPKIKIEKHQSFFHYGNKIVRER